MAKVVCAQSLCARWGPGLANIRLLDDVGTWPMPNAPAKRKSETANPVRSGCIRNSIRRKSKSRFPVCRPVAIKSTWAVETQGGLATRFTRGYLGSVGTAASALAERSSAAVLSLKFAAKTRCFLGLRLQRTLERNPDKQGEGHELNR